MSDCDFARMHWRCCRPAGHLGPHESAPLTAPNSEEGFESKLRNLIHDIKHNTDPDLEPWDNDKWRQTLDMRHRASRAWVLACDVESLLDEHYGSPYT